MVRLAHILTFVTPLAAFANQGIFMVVKGDVQLRAVDGSMTKVRRGDKVKEKDTVITGKNSRAKLVMIDKNVINISPETELNLETYNFENEDDKNVVLNVLYGKVRSTVKQKYDGKKNKYQVKTPSAVAGVRGTDFLSEHSRVTRASKFITFEGRVIAGSGLDRTGNIMNPVTIVPGNYTIAQPGIPPAAPVPVPRPEFARVDKSTQTEAGGFQEDVREPERRPAGEDNEPVPDNESPRRKDPTPSTRDGSPRPPRFSENDGTAPPPDESDLLPPPPPPPPVDCPDCFAGPPQIDPCLTSGTCDYLPPPPPDPTLIDGVTRLRVNIVNQ